QPRRARAHARADRRDAARRTRAADPDARGSGAGPRIARGVPMTASSRAWIAGVVLACGSPAAAQPDGVTITLTGQSMIRSDLRATAPEAIPRMQSLLRGDVVFTNFEGAVAEPGQSVTGGGRGFLAPAETLDALERSEERRVGKECRLRGAQYE